VSSKVRTQASGEIPVSYSGTARCSWVTNITIAKDVALNKFVVVYWKREPGNHKELKDYNKKGTKIK
jgi:hypothetical protein